MAVAAKRKTMAGKARSGAAKGAAAKAPPRKKAVAKAKPKAPRKAAARLSAAEIEALTDRLGQLENRIQDIGAVTFLLKKVLTKALRMTPHLVPLYDEYLKVDDEDGGGGK
jgi:hypothetical protein